jgi:membrane-associated phospholipid phosphatase
MGLHTGCRAGILAVCIIAGPARGQEAAAPPAPDGGYRVDEVKGLPGLLWDDTKALAAAPGSWTGQDRVKAGLGAAAVLATGLLLDHAVDQAVLRNDHPSWRNAARNVAQLGGAGGLVLIGGGYLVTSVLGQDQGRALWVDTGIATVLARATAFAVQGATGRAVPSDGRGSHDFRPLSGQDGFPSGHASQAFAMASAISMHADNPWLGGVAYGLAGLVGLARLETRDHYTSDVVAGALVGTTIGRAVVKVNRGLRGESGVEVSMVPAWSRDYRGLEFVARF